MIEFGQKYSLTNGNKLTKANYHKVVAEQKEPEEKHGKPYGKWRAVEEPEGWIFREINHGSGISGHYSTIRQLIFMSISSNIRVYIED